ncbi:MAG: TonB-dependent receptor [Gammaproteobacteria bacterium]
MGIRGSGLDRSSRIAVLEDGVLMAPAPYASPSAYYFPTQRRMYAMEVLKGPASIPVGPRTIGGALNMVSTPIPDQWTFYGDAFAGADATRDILVRGGGSGDHFGLLFETVQQESDGFKEIDANSYNTDTGYDIEDYLFRGRVNTDPAGLWYTGVEFKYGVTDQDSDSTYLGLTDADFESDPYRQYAATQRDNIKLRHWTRQYTWFLEPAHKPWSVDVTAYNNDFRRNWYKVQSVGGVGISSILDDPATYAQELSWIRGADSPDDAIAIRANNRRYSSEGVQARGRWDFVAGQAEVALTGGLRVHEDSEDRFQLEDGYRMAASDLLLTSEGAPGSQTNRVSTADVNAYFIAADIDVGDWRFSPGLRYEDIELVRRDYSTSDPDRSDGPTRVRSNDVTETIPGLGVTYDLTSSVKLIGGVHKGFNPPAPGSDAEAETSLNWEGGFRYQPGDWYAEAIAFYTDYDNLVGTVTASTGGSGDIGDQFEAGAAHVQGLEVLVETQLAEFGEWVVPARLAWTWTPEAEFDNSFESNFDPWGDVQAGDTIPYIPEQQGQVRLGLHNGVFGVDVNVNYQDKVRTRAGSGAIPASEATDEAVVVDLAARWDVMPRLTLMARVQNLFDEEYVVARRPAGARPGIERWALLGVVTNF